MLERRTALEFFSSTIVQRSWVVKRPAVAPRWPGRPPSLAVGTGATPLSFSTLVPPQPASVAERAR